MVLWPVIRPVVSVTQGPAELACRVRGACDDKDGQLEGFLGNVSRICEILVEIIACVLDCVVHSRREVFLYIAGKAMGLLGIQHGHGRWTGNRDGNTILLN